MRARTVLLTFVVTLLAAEPAAAAAREWVGVTAPKRATAGRPFKVTATARFDKRRYAPPRTYLAAGLWRHRGDDACPAGVPVSRRGWERVAGYDFRPAGNAGDDYPTEFFSAPVTLTRRGTYRHCAYLYAIRYRPTSSRPSYGVLDHDDARTRVG